MSQSSQANPFVTRHQILAGRKAGNIRAFFTLVPRGRPPKVSISPVATAPVGAKKRKEVVNDEDKTRKSITTNKKKRVTRVNYRDPDRWQLLKKAVVDYCLVDELVFHPIPTNTIKDNVIRFTKVAEEHGISINEVTYDMFWNGRATTAQALLNPSQLRFLEDTIIHRDELNNGMSRVEVLKLIMELAQTGDYKKCENHYDYLVREGKLTGLKRGGRVTSAQATTTKRSAITLPQQLRWHTTVDDVFQQLKKLNTPDGYGVDYEDIAEHFFGNMDETCFQANADGSVKVIASSSKKKTEANRDDCRTSITSVRIGNAAGDQGPFVFLAKGKTNDRTCLSKRNIAMDKTMPPGSYVCMTPNAYMTDEAWFECVPHIAEGIRAMPVIKDHPKWWCSFSLDGFGSHVNVNGANRLFLQHRILILKEEGDTSQLNQAYDQHTAKEDKRRMNDNMLSLRKGLGTQLSQWHLIKIAADAQVKIKKNTWINSFIKVNLHPKFRMPFVDWIKKLEADGVMASGKQFYGDETYLYDAMPAFWKRMKPDQREDLIQHIDTMLRKHHEANESPWNKDNIQGLVKFLPLEDIAKARACYYAAKKDDRVITTTKAMHDEHLRLACEKEEMNKHQEQQGYHGDSGRRTIESYFSFKPTELVDAFRKSKREQEIMLMATTPTTCR